MKIVAITLLAFIAAVVAGPVSISDNNVGDIVTVGIKGSIDISNKIDQDIVNVIVAILSQQAIVVAPGLEGTETAQASKFNITPDMIENVKGLLAKN